jgi:hypothetical protein
MAPAYDFRFLTPFRRELSRRGCPSFPQSAWHEALRIADLEQPCSSAPPLRFKDQLYNDETSRFCGVPEPRIEDGRRWWCYSVSKACDRFFAKRDDF